MRSVLTRKLVVLLLALLGALVVLAATRGVWVSGTVTDVAGATPAEATGGEAAPGLAGVALVGAAAAVAALTSGRIGRVVSALALLGVLVVVVVLVVRVLLDPAAVLGSVAGGRSGTTATLPAEASVTAWPWVAAASVVPFALAALGVLLAGGRWSALGADSSGGRSATVAGGTGTGAPRSDWDRLSEGEDPTT